MRKEHTRQFQTNIIIDCLAHTNIPNNDTIYRKLFHSMVICF